MTVEDPLIDRFLTRFQRIKGEDHSTYRIYRKGLESYDDWLDKGADEVSALDIEDFLLMLKSEGYAGNTVATRFTALRKLYTTAEETLGVIDDNPCDGVDIDELDVYNRRENDDTPDYITRAEKEQMIENVPEKHHIRDRLIIELFWQTGVRRNELRNIELDNVNQEDNRIRVFGQKTSEWRTVYYQPSLNRLLDLWIETERPLMQDSKYLFPSVRADQISSAEVGRVIRRAAEGINEIVGEARDGTPKWRITPHTMRHSHAVEALKSPTVDVRSVQMQLGHQNIETTMDYMRLVEDDVAEAYKGFGDGT